MWLKNIILLLSIQFTFAQNQKVVLEEKIYHAIDVFVAHPTVGSLQQLETAEKTFHPKSQSELLAFVILKCNKAYYENQFGMTNKAITNYEKAWQLFQKHKLTNYDIVGSCLQPLGNLYTIIGDYENAENTIKQYFYIANQEHNPEQKYAAILNLSNVYQNTGKLNEAIALLQKTLQSEKLTTSQKGILWNNLGNNYFLSNAVNPAKKAFENSVLFLKSDTSQSETLSNAYRNLATIYSQQKNYEAANSNMQKAVEQFFLVPNKEPRKQAKLYYDVAVLHFQQQHFAEAEVNLKAVFSMLIPGFSKAKTALPKQSSLYAETVLLDALDLQAEIYLAQNKPKKALESYRLSFHIETLLQSLLVYENSKIIQQVRNRNRTEKCIAIYFSLYQKEKKVDYIQAAFLLSEQTKSAVLRQAVSNAKTRTREEKRILEQLQNWNTIILKEQQKLDKANISKINEAIKKQNELMLLLKSKAPKETNQSILDIADLYSKLEKDNAMMVEYFYGREKMYVFTIEGNTIKLDVIINVDAATRKLTRFLNFFSSANAIADNPSGFSQVSNAVYGLVKLPKKPSGKNLIIIPDGILNFIPFDALIAKKSATSDFAKMHFLLHNFTIGYSNSADFYLRAIPFQHKKERVLGVFPLFENTNLELAFSKKELENLKSEYNGKYLDSKNATFGNFRQNAANYSILHLSTHASSGDIFEPASIRFYDQEVHYSELYTLDIHPNLVVLSACETGLGKLYKAEGAMSVARGFQFAGAQNLLFSLWKVNDYTTSVFMEKFYGNVKKGRSYFDANHQAKLDFLADKSISNTKKSPYYWSAFVYYGTLEQKESGINFLSVGLVLLLGIILVLLFRKYRKTL